MIEIFENYENMMYRSEVKEELEYMLNHLGEEPNLESDDAIDDMSAIVDYHRSQGYISALKWVLWDLNDVIEYDSDANESRRRRSVPPR